MSDEISNKTLAMLLVAAIVVSLGGTFFSLTKVAELKGQGVAILGFASASGTANLSISEETAISLTDGLINFGAGTVNKTVPVSATHANLTSNETNSFPFGTWDWGSANEFTLINTGNIEANVSVYGESPSSWIGGGAGSIPDPENWFAVTGGEVAIATSCTGDVSTDWTAFGAASNTTICTELEDVETNNGLNISIKLLIPEDATNTYKENTVVFYAERSNTAD